MKKRKFPITGGEIINISGGADVQAQAMRETITNSMDCLSVRGKVYYVSENGRNENNGESPESPFKTLEAIKSLIYDLGQGDVVLLERGGVYRIPDGIDLISGVTYGAYGVGNKPQIYGSYMNYAKDEIWCRHKHESVWKIPYFPHTDAGIIVFDNGLSAGIKCSQLDELDQNGCYYHDLESNTIYLYCDKGNPGCVYSDIEIGTMTRIFHLERKVHDIIIDNISFKYTGLFGIRADGDCENITITNCTFEWLGGSLFPDGSNRFGNGIEFSSGCNNILIENCWFYQIYDAGATFQIGSKPFRNFTVRNNLFEYTGMGGFEWWASGKEDYSNGEVPTDSTVIENITVENNIIRFSGYGWSLDTRCPCHIRGTWCPRDYPNLKNFSVVNNIFDCSYGFIVACAWTKPPFEYKMFNNTFYQKCTKRIKPEDLGCPAFDVVIGQPTYANNQVELEIAVSKVDSNPQLVKWIG